MKYCVTLMKIALIFCCFFLMGCGFHLRGLPSDSVWIHQVQVMNPKAHPLLASIINKQLKAFGLQSQPLKPSLWLTITKETLTQEISSVSSSTTPRQYQLIYSVEFNAQQKNGKMLLPNTLISSTRQLTINSNHILGSNDEAEHLKNEMRQDIALQMLRRLNRIPKP